MTPETLYVRVSMVRSSPRAVFMATGLALMLGCTKEDQSVPQQKDARWLDSDEVSVVAFHPRREMESPGRSNAFETLSTRRRG